MLRIGIVGLPNVGKSTLFKAITKQSIEIANYPFCTIEPNIGIVPVSDARLQQLAKMERSEKIIPAVIEFVDIAGLVSGAHKGEGLGNQFLSHIREVDAIALVVRFFHDPNVIHVSGSLDPKRDLEIILLELVMADCAVVEKRLQSLEKDVKAKKKDAIIVKEVLERMQAVLHEGKQASAAECSTDETNAVKGLNLLTRKPMMVIANVDEHDVKQRATAPIARLNDPNIPIISISAKIESELADLSEEEAKEFLKEIGLKKNGLEQVIEKGYRLLNLITFLTSGPKETHAWTTQAGTKAPQASGVIHSDFEKGFISMETIQADELIAIGSWQRAKERGKIRMEGKEYVLKDGDVIHVHFQRP